VSLTRRVDGAEAAGAAEGQGVEAEVDRGVGEADPEAPGADAVLGAEGGEGPAQVRAVRIPWHLLRSSAATGPCVSGIRRTRR